MFSYLCKGICAWFCRGICGKKFVGIPRRTSWRVSEYITEEIYENLNKKSQVMPEEGIFYGIPLRKKMWIIPGKFFDLIQERHSLGMHEWFSLQFLNEFLGESFHIPPN